MLMYYLQGLDKKKQSGGGGGGDEKQQQQPSSPKNRSKQKWKCCETVEVSCGTSVHPKELHKFQTCL